MNCTILLDIVANTLSREPFAPKTKEIPIKDISQLLSAIHSMNEIEVKEILKEVIDRKTGEPSYFIKWKGYSEKDCTWGRESYLEHTLKILKA